VTIMTADTFARVGGIANCQRSALFIRKSHESIDLCMGERRSWRLAGGSPGPRHAGRRPGRFTGQAQPRNVHDATWETPGPDRVHCLYSPHLYGIGSSRTESECCCKGHARYTARTIVFEGTNALRGSSTRSLRHARRDEKRSQWCVTGGAARHDMKKVRQAAAMFPLLRARSKSRTKCARSAS